MSGATFCPACGSAVEPLDARCLVCGSFLDALDAAEEQTEQVLQCDGCGAAVSYSIAERAPSCVFCRSVMAVHTLPCVGSAEWFVPFRVTEHEARAAIKATRRVPDDGIIDLRAVWWVGWTLDADAMVSWSADVGTTIDPVPATGQHALQISGQVVPASQGIDVKLCSDLVRTLDLSDARAEAMGPPGAAIERFVRGRASAIGYIRSSIESYARLHLPTQVRVGPKRLKGVTALVTRLATRRFAFPAWVASHRQLALRGTTIVHGQDARCVIHAPLRLRLR